MKVILKDDVEKLGAAGKVVTVADGYARNFLFPKNLAVPASKGNLRSIDEIKKQKQFKENKRRREAEKLKDRLEKLSLTAEVQVGEEDKVFGSVTAANIAALLESQGFEIDRRKIMLEEPLKALGVYTIEIKLATDVIAGVKLWVVKKEEQA
ncbi:MAG: 50S ribosomal protein L9 [candidate division Zixibacteria bacterium RBG_16_53_22]|nr:MAG: 50S ribosomal protein L9 [candidate division Zixibacteria bacterium RBG_16_53_22]